MIPAIGGLPAVDRIEDLEKAMTAHPARIEIEPVHRFAQGLYAREVTLPAGSTAIGHRHAQEHVCIISKGRCLIVKDGETIEITAPHTMIVPPGTKNCVHAIEETIWTTVHATATRDIAALEIELLTAPEGTKCLS